MSDRKYVFTFEDGFMDVESSDGLLDEDQAANIMYWFATEIKPHAPRVALHELYSTIQSAIVSGRVDRPGEFR